MIKSFAGSHRYLSNFFPVIVELNYKYYTSVEHAYQAAKTLDLEDREKIRKVLYAREAKRLGRKVALRKDWEEIKLLVMRSLLEQKFTKNSTLGLLLQNTGPQELIEGNNWGDTFWGVCRGVGENHLGKILMEIRSELHGS